ncbi:MAG: tRNA uridine-5-carboxymethylaminomethyl(34) synthesis GTPase MnmE [Verrucomicrobiales bacterium]
MHDTIAAIATPFGQGAISLIRISGNEVGEILGEIFQSPPMLKPRFATLGTIVTSGGKAVDQVLVTYFPNPASFTGQDLAEISCHGGILVTQKVLETILAAGARLAEPGEFTQRAFLNGKMDLTQAESVMDLIGARTELALEAANHQLEGRLGDRIREIRKELLGVLAHIEAFIDFPDEDIDPDTSEAIASRLRSVAASESQLIATAEQGRILREGVATVICGEPNVGKSSLLNVLLGFDRAIVSDVAGTTRDTIEETINLKGLPLRLIDTAGMRESDDAIEQQGIDRTEQQLQRADLVLEIVDSSQPRGTPIDLPSGKHHLRILNKSDLDRHSSWEGEPGIQFSCLKGDGLGNLADAIYQKLTSGDVSWGADLTAINTRHRACLMRSRDFAEQALAAIAAGQSAEFTAMDVRESLDAIGEVIGKADTEELLGEIFSSFCIGK